MINTWRDLWGMGDFAFIFAQLAPVPGAAMSPQHAVFGSNWPALRLQQAAALPAPGSAVDTSGMAVITDLGDTMGPPHPKNKTEVGRYVAPSNPVLYCTMICSSTPHFNWLASYMHNHNY
eukprot:COSAG06_NODE_271_length_18677_cov_157.113360_14_plen_120_part_00